MRDRARPGLDPHPPRACRSRTYGSMRAVTSQTFEASQSAPGACTHWIPLVPLISPPPNPPAVPTRMVLSPILTDWLSASQVVLGDGKAASQRSPPCLEM